MTAESERAEIPVGRLVGLFGVRGELKCDPTPVGRDLLAAGERFVAVHGNTVRAVTIASIRPHKGRVLVRFEQIADANAAAALVGWELRAERSRVRLAPGEYLSDDLIGCTVYDAAGTALGDVRAVEHYPASDMLVVRGGMIPLVRAFVREIDITARRIVVEIPDGLLERD